MKGLCLSALGTILKDNWEWRRQIVKLAVFDLRRQSRGAVLSWIWFLVRPTVYIVCFWFALDVGLRAGDSVDPNGPPYILWLAAGMVPWFFMSKMIGPGIDVFHRYSYLVNKIKFPLSAISTLFVTSQMLIQLILQAAFFVWYLASGMPLDVYLLQVPVLILLMYIFFDFFSIMMSPLTAMSKDLKNFMGALSTPFFWLSGVIFDVKSIPFDWAQVILYFNPITFFVTAFREAYYEKVWVWEDPLQLIAFIAVFLVTIIMAAAVYKRFNQEVSDAL